MNELEARAWLDEQFSVSRETIGRLEAFEKFLWVEAQDQNLIARSTLDHIWTRHFIDSAQILKFVTLKPDHGRWIDLGSGAGLPGIIIALLSDFDVTLVESRAKRIDYLKRAVALLGLENRVTVAGMPLERLETAPFSVISARAFAPLPRLFHLAKRFSTNKTLWLLPKGRNAAKEWDDIRQSHSGDFRVEQSVTDADAGILVGYLDD
jgi:16S rRNA (guanine527-N7)-methyltransferase